MYFRCFCAMLATSLGLAFGVWPATAQEPDSLLVDNLQEVVVSAVRASKEAPFAVANLSRRELQDFSSSGRELPMLFSRTPGIISWSENGVGTGTTYLRIRGAGGSRINVTLDGVPLNSPNCSAACKSNAASAPRPTAMAPSAARSLWGPKHLHWIRVERSPLPMALSTP